MFKKVLIAEDLECINSGLEAALKDLNLSITHAKYCDEAFLKIRKGLKDNEPYDLLITDLSFEQDHREEKLTSGEALLEAVTEVQSELKTIVFSVENRPMAIKRLFDEQDINAYVCKGRRGLYELKEAIQLVYEGGQFISNEVRYAMKDSSAKELDTFDMKVLQQLAIGLTQEQIAETFKINGVKPNSLSTIEKRINKLKVYFKAQNPTHLIAITKDMGLI